MILTLTLAIVFIYIFKDLPHCGSVKKHKLISLIKAQNVWFLDIFFCQLEWQRMQSGNQKEGDMWWVETG